MRKGTIITLGGILLAGSLSAAVPSLSQAADAAFAPVTNPPPLPPGVAVLFGPGDRIADRMVAAVESARNEILVNQSVFTNGAIARALVDAFKRRKVTVVVLLEPSPRLSVPYQTPSYFAINGVPVFAAASAPFSNNKYMVIDRTTVVTGSFDYTEASTRADENVLIISEAGVAARYYNHFVSRLRASKPFPIPAGAAAKP